MARALLSQAREKLQEKRGELSSSLGELYGGAQEGSCVVFLDDSESFRQLGKVLLNLRLGMKVVDFASAAEALGFIKATREQIAIVFSDYNMPEMNGLEFAKELRALGNLNKIPFVLLSSDCDLSSSPMVDESIKKGEIDAFLPKDCIGKFLLKTTIDAVRQRITSVKGNADS